MLTIAEIIEIEKARIARRQPSEEDLRRIPLARPARVFGRLSDPKQIQESLQSMAELAALVRLARQDGFHTELSQEEVERRLGALQRGDPDAMRYWVDEQLTVDLRDLGISGRLGPDKRPALAELMADLSRGGAPDVTGTIYLSSEGLSRLSRDQDRIVSAQLLKLMKEASCRVRTPYDILNPKIDADWKELREGFEDAAKESRHLQEKHFGPKKREKALKGEHVGNPAPPGFIIEIKGYKSNGAYIFGKWLPYPPHTDVDIKILEEYVRQQGSKYKTAQALRGLVFPFFPPELKYMETRSSLRNCFKTNEGYIITPEVVDGLAGQLALIGIWKWADILIDNNHRPAVPVDLFREAYELRNQRGGKPRGRAVYYEPLDWNGLLWCLNHETPRYISGHNSEGTWVCDRDYHNSIGPYCLKIDHRIVSQPLTTEFLKCLDLRSYAREVFDELQIRSMTIEAEEAMRKHQETQLRNRLTNLENYLGSADPELEESYRRQIKQVKADLRALQQKPLPTPVTVADINRVQHFLENLEDEWHKLSSSLRNRLLNLLVDRVEIVHERGHIQALVIWKIGFKQGIDIKWLVGASAKERRWTDEQDNLLRTLWSTSIGKVLLAAFPERTWRAITVRASKLGLMRKVRLYPSHWEPWTGSDDARLAELYVTETPVDVIAAELGRSISAVAGRAHLLKINKPKEATFLKRMLSWEVLNFYGLEAVSPSIIPTYLRRGVG
ncbi:MAG: hypothetical protein DDT29_00895 [Dehalococcoidia bacterium]|nr:hypothetical protein [Bacillota bacterium]